MVIGFNGIQTQVLVDFQALLALVSGDELNLRVRDAVRGQPREHLVPEQMRVNRCLIPAFFS
jgi:hypothetical protein